jgi:hypothetical protein
VRVLGAFGAFVFLPVLMTAMAPISTIRLERSGETVRAEVRRHIMLFIPYRNETVEGVTGVNESFEEGGSSRRSTLGSTSSRGAITEDSAYITLNGNDHSATVEISPVNYRGAAAKIQALLEDPAQPRLRLVAVANWKFSVLAGGVLSLMSYLFFAGLIYQGVRRLVRLRARQSAL